MPYEVLEAKIKTLPAIAFEDVVKYVDELSSRYNKISNSSIEEGLRLLHAITGVVSSDVDLATEKQNYLDEKY